MSSEDPDPKFRFLDFDPERVAEARSTLRGIAESLARTSSGLSVPMSPLSDTVREFEELQRDLRRPRMEHIEVLRNPILDTNDKLEHVREQLSGVAHLLTDLVGHQAHQTQLVDKLLVTITTEAEGAQNRERRNRFWAIAGVLVAIVALVVSAVG